MSVTVMANSGILSDDYLDNLRFEAIQHSDEIHESVKRYLRALEIHIIDTNAQAKRKFVTEHLWL